MPKHIAHHPKTATRHAGSAPAHRVAKVPPASRTTAKKAMAPVLTMMLEPKPTVIEVMELDFADPDIALDEEALVTDFEDEDL